MSGREPYSLRKATALTNLALWLGGIGIVGLIAGFVALHSGRANAVGGLLIFVGAGSMMVGSNINRDLMRRGQ